jgi:hypothetical protein
LHSLIKVCSSSPPLQLHLPAGAGLGVAIAALAARGSPTVAEVAALATGADRYAFAGIGALSLAKAAQAFPHHFLAFIVACCRIVFLDRSFMHPT